MKKKGKFYNLERINKLNANYNIIIGGRGNGKTFAVHAYALQRYMDTGEQTIIVRRWRDDFTGARGSQMFSNQATSGSIEKITQGLWTDVYYYRSRWYLCKYDEGGDMIKDVRPFAFGLSLSGYEHDKSTAFPDVSTIIFDEFISVNYIPDEFVIFMNVLSTIIRHRTNVKIYMLGNTINKYCPYFSEMGLKHVSKMEPGAIELYKYGGSSLTVAVEYSENKVSKETNAEHYFAFDNPKLEMITGNAWEIDIYPHAPTKWKPKNILFIFFIEFNELLYQCEVISKDSHNFIFIHKKTTPIQNIDKDIIFSLSHNSETNRYISPVKPIDKMTKKISWYFNSGNVFYQDNDTGDAIRNYIEQANRLL